MNRNMNFSLFSTALLLSALAASLPCQAAPKNNPAPRAAARTQAQPQVFTVRYVVFVATPKKAMTPEEVKATSIDLPPVFDELQHGSAAAVMNTTPEGFLNKARRAQTDYKFQRLLSGSVTIVNGSEEPAAINDTASDSNDPFQTALNESIFLEWNSPTTLTLHHTGNVAYTIGNFTRNSRGGPGWDNTHTDKIVLGRTYSQGVDNQPDGRKIIYAFCFLPGKLDQTASAWNKQKTVAVVNKNGKESVR